MSNQQPKLVQMRLLPVTLDRIENLSKLTRIDNRTQLISSSIQLTEELVSNMKAGGKVYIEKPDGTKHLIQLVGL